MIYLRFKDGVLQVTDQERPTEPKYSDYVQHTHYYWQVKKFERAKRNYSEKAEAFESSWLPVVNHREIIEHIDRLPNRQIQTLIDGKEYQIEGKIERQHGECGHPCEEYKDECQHYGCKEEKKSYYRVIPEKKDYKFIDHEGHRYWYEHRSGKDNIDICLATENPEQYCNGVYLFCRKDPGNGKAFVVVQTTNPKWTFKNSPVPLPVPSSIEKPFCGPVVGVILPEKKESLFDKALGLVPESVKQEVDEQIEKMNAELSEDNKWFEFCYDIGGIRFYLDGETEPERWEQFRKEICEKWDIKITKKNTAAVDNPFCGPVVGVPEYGEKKDSVEISIPYEEIVRSVASLRAELEMWREEAKTLRMEVESLKAEIYILRK